LKCWTERIVVLLLGCAAQYLPAQAMTLGGVQGSALLGRSLDLSVRVQAQVGDDLSLACFAADVFHAEQRQPRPRLSIIDSTADTVLLRIESAAQVDEPVVSVDLRSTCGSLTTRRYVLLADVPDPAAVRPAVAPLALATVPAPIPTTVPQASASAAGLAAAGAASGAPATASSRSNAASSKPALAKPTAKKSAAKSGGVVPAAAAGTRPVLRLDPLDIFSDRVGALDAPMQFAPPAHALQQAEQIDALQKDMLAMRTAAAQAEQQVLSLRLQLQQTQQQQVSLTWVYVLGLMCALCLLGVLWLARQLATRTTAATGWNEVASTALVVSPPADDSLRAPAAEPAVAAPVSVVPTTVADPVTSAPKNSLEWVVATAKMGASLSGPLPPGTSNAGQTESGPSNVAQEQAQGEVHSFSVEPILDIRQQAEFFVSLGQNERALEVLKKQIAHSSGPNPFIYLDLLTLLHSLGMKMDFRHYRTLFRQHFAADMPDFPAFHLQGHDLQAYPEVLAQLSQDWPSAHSLGMLNGWIVHRAQDPAQPLFELAAFHDLLMLHALAEELVGELPAPTQAPARIAERAVPTSVTEATVVSPVGPLVGPLDLDFSSFDAEVDSAAAKPAAPAPGTEPQRNG